MSRSFKHTPYTGEKKSGKQFANRKVRRHLNNLKDLDKGCSYKKLYEQWNICDYSGICTYEEYKQSYWFNPEDKRYYYNKWLLDLRRSYSENELYTEWAKSYLWK